MANAGSGPGDIFDVRKIRRLVELMNEHDLSVMDLKQGEQRIRLRRGSDPGQVIVSSLPEQGAAASAPATAASANVPTAAAGTLIDITSPMVGTFYAAASPDSPPFVKVGDHVGPETPVCIVEAMKVFNEIPAEASGQIVAVLVENGDAVEFGQPLFRVNPSA
jgi:acetyl-CoA carboxylase biotin carboxyl carrier protein